jgi:hypothetical protein
MILKRSETVMKQSKNGQERWTVGKNHAKHDQRT